jgi:hypothetical protein
MLTILDIRRLELAERIRELEEKLKPLLEEQCLLADCVPATDGTDAASDTGDK